MSSTFVLKALSLMMGLFYCGNMINTPSGLVQEGILTPERTQMKRLTVKYEKNLA
jgi:hypothetical protein